MGSAPTRERGTTGVLVFDVGGNVVRVDIGLHLPYGVCLSMCTTSTSSQQSGVLFFRTVGLACFQYDARCAGKIFCLQFQHSHPPYPSRVTHTLSDLFVGLTKMDED